MYLYAKHEFSMGLIRNYFYGIILFQMRKNLSRGQIGVKEILSELINETGVQIFRRKANKLCQQPLASQITSKEYQSIEQIRATTPKTPFCTFQDDKPKRLPTDTIRPFSAQVHRRPKTPQINIKTTERSGSHQRNSSNQTNLASNRTLTNSSKNIRRQPKIKTFDSIDESLSQKKLIALKTNAEEEDENEKFIDKLRQIKTKAEEYQKQKQNFMKQIDKERDEYAITQKKLVSTLSRKDFTYSYNGTIVQVGKNKGMIKKKCRNIQKMRNGTRKSETDGSKCEKIMINYSSSEMKNDRKKYVFGQNQEINSLKQLESGNLKFLQLVDYQQE